MKATNFFLILSLTDTKLITNLLLFLLILEVLINLKADFKEKLSNYKTIMYNSGIM